MKALLLLLALCSVARASSTAVALPDLPTVTLSILNAPTTGGELVIVSSDAVEVQFVTIDPDGVLDAKDTIELVNLDTGEVVSKKKRGTLASGTVSLNAKGLTHGFVRYVSADAELARVPVLEEEPILVIIDPAILDLLQLITALELWVEDLENQPPVEAGLPVGTITGWHQSLAGTPSLPLTGEWLECNGQLVSDPDSPYDGLFLPDLNGPYVAGQPGGMFLRGGEVTGLLQGDALQSHDHKQGRGRGIAGQGIYHAWQTQGALFGWEPFMYQAPAYDAAGNLVNPMGQSVDELALTNSDPLWGRTAFAGMGNRETRPANMSVTWIIRIK